MIDSRLLFYFELYFSLKDLYFNNLTEKVIVLKIVLMMQIAMHD